MRETEKMEMGWKWGNLVTMLNQNHQITSKMFANTFVAYTQYRFNITMKEEYLSEYKDGNKYEKDDYYNFTMGYKSSVNDWSIGTNFDWMPHPNHDVKYGGSYTFHTFRPAISTLGTKYGVDEMTFEIDTG